MQKDIDRITEGQKLLKQLREEYGRLRTQGAPSETPAIVGAESYLEPSLSTSVS